MAESSGQRIVRMMLEAGEVTVDELAALIADDCSRPACPTHEQHLAAVLEVCPPASASTYGTGFRRVVEAFGACRLDEVGPHEIEVLCRRTQQEVRDAAGSDGAGAVRNLLYAARFFYRVAHQRGFIASNPAAQVPTPAPRRRARRALTAAELLEVYEVAAAAGDDTLLDVLLLDFHRETAARRAGAVALRLMDLRADRGSVLLREKGGHEREVPCGPDLQRRIRVLAEARGASSAIDAAFHYRRGTPLTRRRYNTLFSRIHKELPWAARLGVSIHWLRHTTLTDISNAAGSRIAAAYAGHADRSVTDRYTVPAFEDLVRAHDLVFPAQAIRSS